MGGSLNLTVELEHRRKPLECRLLPAFAFRGASRSPEQLQLALH